MQSTHESQPKSKVSLTDVRLPFVCPLKASNGHTIWPFREKGWPLFNGLCDAHQKCVLIKDESAVIAIHSMGFFGDKHEVKAKQNDHLMIDMVTEKDAETDVDLLSTKQLENKSIYVSNTEKAKFNYSDGKYVLVPTVVSNSMFTFSKESDAIKTFKSEAKPLPIEHKIDCKNKCDTNDAKNWTTVSLKLSFEEAFFLSYCFGCLIVINNENKTYMNIEEMWKYYCLKYNENHCKFAIFYSAYHFFRSKGWIVKSGFSFGSDFLLYKEGPPFYHALYSVTVIQQCSDGKCDPNMNWHQLAALLRLTKSVRKEVLLCYVSAPQEMDIHQIINSPQCIQNFTIKLMHFDRWIASQKVEEKSQVKKKL